MRQATVRLRGWQRALPLRRLRLLPMLRHAVAMSVMQRERVYSAVPCFSLRCYAAGAYAICRAMSLSAGAPQLRADADDAAAQPRYHMRAAIVFAARQLLRYAMRMRVYIDATFSPPLRAKRACCCLCLLRAYASAALTLFRLRHASRRVISSTLITMMPPIFTPPPCCSFEDAAIFIAPAAESRLPLALLLLLFHFAAFDAS